jgi:hypothetical protein
VAATGRQLALLPVVAHHRGTYWSYLHCWLLAAQLWQHSLQYTVADVAGQLGLTGPQFNHQQQQEAEQPAAAAQQGREEVQQQSVQVQQKQAGAGQEAPPPAVPSIALSPPEPALASQPLRQVLLLNAGMTRQQLLQQLVQWGSPLAATLLEEEQQAQQLSPSVQQGMSSWLTHPV